MLFYKSWASALMKAAFAASALCVVLLSGCSEQKPAFASVDVTGADYARNFELTDHNGQVRHLTDFAG